MAGTYPPDTMPPRALARGHGDMETGIKGSKRTFATGIDSLTTARPRPITCTGAQRQQQYLVQDKSIFSETSARRRVQRARLIHTLATHKKCGRADSSRCSASRCLVRQKKSGSDDHTTECVMGKLAGLGAREPPRHAYARAVCSASKRSTVALSGATDLRRALALGPVGVAPAPGRLRCWRALGPAFAGALCRAI